MSEFPEVHYELRVSLQPSSLTFNCTSSTSVCMCMTALYPAQMMDLLSKICICKIIRSNRNVYVDVHVVVHVDVYVDVHVDVHVDVYVEVHTDVHVNVHVDVHVAVYVNKHVYIIMYSGFLIIHHDFVLWWINKFGRVTGYLLPLEYSTGTRKFWWIERSGG